MELRVKHISGLGFTPGSYVTIKRSAEELVLLGVEEKDAVPVFKGASEGKKERVNIEKRLHIADLINVKLSPTTEQSSDYGTVVKTFIVLTINNASGFTYEAHLGGDEFKRITPAYNDFIVLLTQGSPI